jgi:endonuclease III
VVAIAQRGDEPSAVRELEAMSDARIRAELQSGGFREREPKIDLAEYIKSLPDFKLHDEIRSPGEPVYQHMGAVLTDTILQAGLDYDKVVLPKVLRVLENYPEAATTSGLLNVLESKGYQEVLQWNDDVKPDRLKRLATFLQDRDVETVTDLKTWLLRPESRRELLGINGVGPKTADYLPILAGLPSVAVDRHIRRFCAEAGIKKNVSKAVKEAAAELRVDEGFLDYSIWFYMSRRGPQ